jgi:hypothetical protein
MSKVDELRKRFSNITNLTFQKFVEADKTETKKYLEYCCIIWNYRLFGGCSISTKDLVTLVSKFDELLPYINNKDIYSSEYRDINNLKQVISDAEYKKSEKAFNRLEHIDVLIENDEYLLLSPKTHEGSIRYGANTRWCTASRKDKSTFNTYSKNRTLVYLISKNNKPKQNYQKVAFVLEHQDMPLTSYIQCWNQIDSNITEETVIKNGWEENDFMEIIFAIRYYSLQKHIKISAINNVKTTINFLTSINFNQFEKNLEILNKSDEKSLVSETKKLIGEFNEKMKNFLK